MTTHNEWLSEWAKRWVLDGTSEIQRRQKEIAGLRRTLADATDDEQRDWIESLIDQHEGIIKNIRLFHHQWQRRAKRRWQVQMPDLPR